MNDQQVTDHQNTAANSTADTAATGSTAPQTWHRQAGPNDSQLLVRELTCANFMQAIELINQVAQLAEAADHHPDLHLTSYKQLRIELSSHHAGHIVTERDHRLAVQIEALLDRRE